VKKSRVLVVDDHVLFRKGLVGLISSQPGMEMAGEASDGVEAVDTAGRVLPDLIILDVNMPRMDGIEACRLIRRWTDTPIIMLSVREDQKDKVLALDEGADDYVTKPFGIEELLARVRVALRHSPRPSSAAPVFTAGDLEIDLSRRVVKRMGKVVKLTRTEYDLLAYLALNCDKLVTHKDLLTNVWGPEYGEELEYVRLFIWQVRRKIEDDPKNPRFILTEPRVGYRMVRPD